MQIGKLFIDPLAVAALVGFGCLILNFLEQNIWLWRKSGKGAGEL